LPEAKIGFAPRGEWTFPAGTVFVKQFELATNESDPLQRRRLETRLLVRSANGSVYGATYKWRPDNSDADLLPTNLTENVLSTPRPAPGRKPGIIRAARIAGLATPTAPAASWASKRASSTANHQRLEPPRPVRSSPSDAVLASCEFLARPDDTSRSLADRARSYLDVNCANCHRPGGTVAYFDARYDTPLEKQGLIDGPVLINEGIDHARMIAPNDRWRSILYMRANTVEGFKMPPLARQTVDQAGMALLRQWIESLGGRPCWRRRIFPCPPAIIPNRLM
jgi:mono/diheme cytochrome c family protein